MMFSSWFFLALLGAFLQAVGLALKKHALRESGANSLVAAGIFLGAGIILFVTHFFQTGQWWFDGPVPLSFWGGAGITVLFASLGVLFSYRALDLGDLSAVTPYSVFGTLLLFLPAWILLHETPKPAEILGACVIIAGAFLLEGGFRKKRDVSRQDRADRARNRKALGYFSLAMVFYSISPTGDKIAVTATEPLFAAYVIHLGIALSFLCILALRKKYRDLDIIRRAFSKRSFVFALILAAIVAGYANLSTYFALSDGSVGGVMSIKRTMPFFAFFIGYAIFRERKNARRKLMGTIVMIAGALVIGFSG